MPRIISRLLFVAACTVASGCAAINVKDGFEALNEGKYEIALEKFRAAAEGGDARGQFAYGQFHEYGVIVPQNAEEAERWYEAAKNDPQVLQELAWSLGSRGRFLAQSRKMIELALEARPDNPDALATYGRILYKWEDYEAAAEQYQKALAVAPNNPRILKHAGDAYWQAGRKDRARVFWAKHFAVLEDHATRRQRIVARVRDAIEWGDDEINLQQALEVAQEAVELAPDQPGTINALAWATFRLGRYDDAVKLYERALKLRPENAFYHHKLGEVHWKAGRRDTALEMWHKALSLDGPNDPDTLRRYAFRWAREGWNLDDAWAFAERAMKLRPDDPRVLNAAGMVRYSQGDYDAAKALFEEALAGHRLNPYYQSRVADSLWQLGQRDEARRLWQEAHEMPWLQPDLARDLDARLADGLRSEPATS